MASYQRGRSYIPYEIPLGKGERARLVLPHHMSTTEAERICAVIRSLAFPDELLAEAALAAEEERKRHALAGLIDEWAAES